MLKMDLNLDAGESEDALADGSEARLYALVSSVNIACGGHTGDEATMRSSVRLAKQNGLSVGAHPSFPDRAHFGRREMTIGAHELSDSLAEQILRLATICKEEDVRLMHVKAHGALYSVAAKDKRYATCVLDSVILADPELKVMGLAGSPFLKWAEETGLSPLAEAFCDRRYEADGSLRARSFSDAVIDSADEAAAQALEIALRSRVKAVTGDWIPVKAQSLCIHGDTLNALAVAQAVREALSMNSVGIGL